MTNKYKEIIDKYIKKIETSELAKIFPSESEIAKENNISKATAAKVLFELKKHGYITTKVGTGSFINHRKKKITIKVSTDGEFYHEHQNQITELLNSEFKNCEFYFNYDYNCTEFDINLVFTNSTEINFENNHPVSTSFLEENINKNLFFEDFFSLYCNKNQEHIAVPYLLSSTGFLYNKNLADKLQINVIDKTLLDILKNILENKKEHFNIFDINTYASYKELTYLILEHSKEKTISYPHTSIIDGIKLFTKIIDNDFDANADIKNGNTLFKLIHKMTPAKYFQPSENYEPALFNPKKSNHNINLGVSNAIAISRSTNEKDLCEDILTFFLSDNMQTFFTKTGFGFPVNSQITYNHYGTSNDPFETYLFNNLKHIVFNYGFVPRKFIDTMHHYSHLYLTKVITSQEYIRFIQNILLKKN